MNRNRQFLALALLCALGCQRDGSATKPHHPGQPMRAESGEVVLASNYDQAGTTKGTASLNSNNWVGATFKPVVPPEATGVAFTSVTLSVVKAGGVQGSADYPVQLRRVDAVTGKPIGGVQGLIDQGTIAVASLPTGTSGVFPTNQVTVAFSYNSGLDPTKKYFIGVCPGGFCPSGFIGTQAGGTQSPTDMAYAASTTGGGIWNAPSTAKDVCVFEVKGTYSTP